MTPGSMAARNQVAMERIIAAGGTIAGLLGLDGAADALKAATHRDPAIKAMRQREAVADMLNTVAGAMGSIGGERQAELDDARKRGDEYYAAAETATAQAADSMALALGFKAELADLRAELDEARAQIADLMTPPPAEAEVEPEKPAAKPKAKKGS